MKLLVIFGTRGIPNRYGGFETLADSLSKFAPRLSVNVEVASHHNQSSTSTQRFYRFLQSSHFETLVLTWALSRHFRKTNCKRIFVNPITVFSAKPFASGDPTTLLHMDGMEDLRGKWGFIAKRVHRVARYAAVKSSLQLVTDSRVIQEWYREKYSRETIYIPYGGCEVAEADAEHRWNPSGSGDFYMVLARPEPENQIFEICRAFLNSSSPFRLVVVGAPRAPTEYWKKVQRLVGDSPRVHLAGSIYSRDRRCEMYVNTRGVIHGHTVGGTNPSLVDALSHGCPVLPHGNPYNREVAGETGVYWNSEEELVAILNDADRVYPRIDADGFITRYNWHDVANAYFTALGLLSKERTEQ